MYQKNAALRRNPKKLARFMAAIQGEVSRQRDKRTRERRIACGFSAEEIAALEAADRGDPAPLAKIRSSR